MNQTEYNEKSFAADVLLTKNIIKDMTDAIHDCCPSNYHMLLPALHKAYDCMSMIQFYLRHISNDV